MVVWFATGRSVADWIRPVLQFALPFVVAVTVVSFVVAPWANGRVSEYQQRFAQREDVSQVSPGQFRESASADRVFFVESISEDQQSVRNVFVSQLRGEKLTIVVAAGGRVENQPDGERFLVLDKGRRYDGERTGQEFRLMEFDRYAVRLEPKETAVRDDSAKVKPTLELVRNPTPRNLGELMWRMSMPLASVTLVLLAIPLSSFNPRAGRSVNLMVALLIYVIYNNMVSLSQAWLFQSKLSFPVAAFGAHLAVLAIAAFLFWRRLRMPRRPWRWRRSGAAA
jgi:lipopolysaccharide export system permease protein